VIWKTRRTELEDMSDTEHRGSGLNETQWQQLKTLTASLNPAQTTWVSGFFAGLDYAARADLLPENGAAVTSPISDPANAPSTRTLTILYGTETGNSAALATTLSKQAAACGLSVTMHDMAAYKYRKLRNKQDLVIIASTYGEGDPPQASSSLSRDTRPRSCRTCALPSWRSAIPPTSTTVKPANASTVALRS
jgi:sulfite reductase (NADPH) flavoprotein alpha-component